MSTQVSNPSEGWFKVPNDLIDFYGPVLGPHGLAIYFVLKRHESNQSKSCFPSIKRICKFARLSKNTVSKYLKRMEKFRLIKIIRRKSKSGDYSANLYVMLLPQVPVPMDTQPKQDVRTLYTQSVDSVCTVSGTTSFEPPQVDSESTLVKSSEEVGHAKGTNKTFQQDEDNKTHLRDTKDCHTPTEFLKDCHQELKTLIPDFDNVKFQFLWDLALKRKGQDPTKAKRLFEFVIQSAKRQKRGIKKIIPWLVSGIKEDYWSKSQKFKKSNPKKNWGYPQSSRPIIEKDEEEGDGAGLEI